MKKSFILSLIIHMMILLVIVITTAMMPDEKKVEPIRIKILIPQIQRAKPEPPVVFYPTLAESVSPVLSKPTLPSPVVQPTIQPAFRPLPTNTALIAPVESIQPIKSVETPIQETVEPPVAKSIPPKAAPVESVKTNPRVKENYIAYIRQLIDERKIYPKNAKRLKQTGTTTIRFKILEDGAIENISVTDSSGFELLDQAAKDLLENIAHFKPFPKELGDEPIDLTVPIEYTLR